MEKFHCAECGENSWTMETPDADTILATCRYCQHIQEFIGRIRVRKEPKPSSFDKGLEFHNESSGETMRYIHPQSSHWAPGWIIVRHTGTGKWNTLRKATEEDLDELIRPRNEDGCIRLVPMEFDGHVTCTCEKCQKCKRRQYSRKKILQKKSMAKMTSMAAADPVGV